MGMGEGKPRGEVKIVYREGDVIRAVRGRLVGEDEFFFILMRRDGQLRISKSITLKLEEVGGRRG